MLQYVDFRIEEHVTKRTNRLLSGSKSHCSKSVSTKLRLDLSAKEDTSGSCNSSTSNDAVSLTTSMLILSKPWPYLSFTNRTAQIAKRNLLERAEFQCLWIETACANQILYRNGTNVLEPAADWAGTLDLSTLRNYDRLRCWLRRRNGAAIWWDVSMEKECAREIKLDVNFCRDPREFGGRDNKCVCRYWKNKMKRGVLFLYFFYIFISLKMKRKSRKWKIGRLTRGLLTENTVFFSAIISLHMSEDPTSTVNTTSKFPHPWFHYFLGVRP